MLGGVDDYSNDYESPRFAHYLFGLPVPADTVGWCGLQK